jgi:hypothetical protein
MTELKRCAKYRKKIKQHFGPKKLPFPSWEQWLRFIIVAWIQHFGTVRTLLAFSST